MKKIKLAKNDVIVFQGDSVTDCLRSTADDSYLGNGYANLVAANLQAKYPELNLTIYNRGVSGNRIYDVENRWEEDCIQLSPTVVSILIGINDTWRRFDSGILSPITDYQASYKRIIEKTLTQTKASLVLMDPFVLPYPEDRIAWRQDLEERIFVVRNLAKEYNAIYIPLDGLFAAATVGSDYSYWCIDGVHPTLAGHGLIAKAWLDIITD